MIDLARSGANVLITRSFPNLYGLAGLRIGYGIANTDSVRRLESLRISIPNQAGVSAARASLGDAAFRTDIRRKIGDSIAFSRHRCQRGPE
jgi:histidinol-phosphate aminotransferase